MNIAFAGTPDFAAVHLQALIDSGWRPRLVLTQPDRPAGRGRKLQPSPVKALALEQQLSLHQPERFDPETLALLQQQGVELLIVVAYGLLLPKFALEALPALNVHASLLPRWRGAAPIEHALLTGDARTGISIMRIVEALDSGPMLSQQSIAIDSESTSGSLRAQLAQLGSAMLVATLQQLAAGQQLTEQPQQDSAASYAPKISKAMHELDCRKSSAELDRQIRALGFAWLDYRSQRLRIHQARPSADLAAPRLAAGTLSTNSERQLLLHCGQGCLELIKLQRPGKGIVSGRDMTSYLLSKQLLGAS